MFLSAVNTGRLEIRHLGLSINFRNFCPFGIVQLVPESLILLLLHFFSLLFNFSAPVDDVSPCTLWFLVWKQASQGWYQGQGSRYSLKRPLIPWKCNSVPIYTQANSWELLLSLLYSSVSSWLGKIQWWDPMAETVRRRIVKKEWGKEKELEAAAQIWR